MKNPLRVPAVGRFDFDDAVSFLQAKGVKVRNFGFPDGASLKGDKGAWVSLSPAGVIRAARARGFKSSFRGKPSGVIDPETGKVRGYMARSRANPKRLRVSAAALAKGAAQFKRFQGRPATRGARVSVPDPPAVVVYLGELVQVNYRTRKGKNGTVEYYHRFTKPLPILVSDPKGKHLYVVGGRFKITDRGIEK